ncbi:Uncharacterised protein [Klebsiella pneumoniae]|uniref:hypothetical protein n=1 Tax=Klebsiella pneumoniae TaxID=573 RepID=UPI0009B9B049|nr:hypothetical protein [Klebsiella pneumoniae]MBV0560687.1 hypothetical protein [Klebsiella pneumoniae]SLO49380.1 Uncharacterised protein [Klebsiella pneumoniae]SLO67639.1 Uncharacterised protein [Klebsiella pneumoniae]SLO69931.1 Uncharacterised protein [Klebsiella pneumoniae]SLO71248.1 Uncharacterised protein [Klebsiella pneumoniae]
MNIETVNELIATLESAGELSIREQKFLKLAKEFRICSASLDAAIKTGNMLADQNAQLAAENVALKAFVGECAIAQGEGNWISDVEKTVYVPATEWMPPTPATDRIVAGIKADAIDEAAVDLDRVDTVASTRVIGFKLRELAKQLREGADK